MSTPSKRLLGVRGDGRYFTLDVLGVHPEEAGGIRRRPTDGQLPLAVVPEQELPIEQHVWNLVLLGLAPSSPLDQRVLRAIAWVRAAVQLGWA